MSVLSRMLMCSLTVCALVSIHGNAYCVSNILDSLYHENLSGQVFVNDWGARVYAETSTMKVHPQISLNSYDAKELKEGRDAIIRPEVKAIKYKYIDESLIELDEFKMDKWISCETINKPQAEQKMITLAEDKKITLSNAEIEFEYKINDHIVGYISGYVINDQIVGDYKFVNGEVHETGVCVDRLGYLVYYHNLVSLSEKGKLVKANNNIKEYLFNNEANYDKDTGDFKLNDFSGTMAIENVSSRLKSLRPVIETISNEAFFKAVITPPTDSIEFSATIELDKCDKTPITINDTIEKVENIHNSNVHIDYYYLDYKYMEFDGLIRQVGTDRVIKPHQGVYKLGNGDIIREYACSDKNTNNNKKFITQSNSEFGKKLVEKTGNLKKSADKKDIENTATEKKKKIKLEADLQKKLAAFRKSAKLGTHVSGYGGTKRGTITKVNGDMCEVQFTEGQYSKMTYTGSVPYQTVTWNAIIPFKEWVSRDKLGPAAQR